MEASISFPFPPEVIDMTLTGTVLAVDEPHLLSCSWGGEVLRFELAADGGGTLLVLYNELPPSAPRHATRRAGTTASTAWPARRRYRRLAGALRRLSCLLRAGPRSTGGPPRGVQGRVAARRGPGIAAVTPLSLRPLSVPLTEGPRTKVPGGDLVGAEQVPLAIAELGDEAHVVLRRRSMSARCRRHGHARRSRQRARRGVDGSRPSAGPRPATG